MSTPPTDETSEIVVEKSVDSTSSRVATVVCSIRSTGEETSSITVIDTLPTGCPDGRLGFHDDRAMDYWRIGEDAMILECDLASGAELVARYAVWLDEDTSLADLRTPPRVEVTAAGRSPTVSIDVNENGNSTDADQRGRTGSSAGQPAGGVTDSRGDAEPSTDHTRDEAGKAESHEDRSASPDRPGGTTVDRRRTATAEERDTTEVSDEVVDALREEGPPETGDSDASTVEAVETHDSRDGSRSDAGTTSDSAFDRNEDTRLADEVETLAEHLGATIERLDELEGTVARSGGVAHAIEEDFTNITYRLDTLDAEIDRLHARLSERSGDESSIDRIDELAADVDDRFDALEAELDRIRDEFESDLALLRHDMDIIQDEVDPTIEW